MPSAKVSPLEAHLGYWLRMVSNHVSGSFRRRVEDKGATVAEWVVLRELFDREHARPSDVAAALGMTRGAISKLVDRLTAKGLAEKTVSEEDRRYQSVTLTRAGRALAPQLASLADRNDEKIFSVLSEAERRTLLRLMKKLTKAHGLRTVPTE